LNSSNFAQWEAQVQSNIVRGRQWVATRDNRTREEHAKLDGDFKPLLEPFAIGSDTGMHPGDFGEAANSVNCRCTTTPVVEGQEPKSTDVLDAVWKRYDDNLRPWERETYRGVGRALDLQTADCVAALRA
jgi:hypothetical protein